MRPVKLSLKDDIGIDVDVGGGDGGGVGGASRCGGRGFGAGALGLVTLAATCGTRRHQKFSMRSTRMWVHPNIAGRVRKSENYPFCYFDGGAFSLVFCHILPVAI
jgi:hypothetical protein